MTPGLFALLLVIGLTPTQAQAYSVLAEEGRTAEWSCLDEIVEAESSWRSDAVGDRHLGYSYGLVQRHATAHGAPPWPWPVADQIRWALDYADERYGGLCEAAEERRKQGWW